MIIFAISNEKGGQAKTTTAAALSEGTAKRGYRVLAIDGDPQGALSYELNDGEPLPGTSGLYEVITGKEKVQSAVMQTRTEGVYLLRATNELAGLDRELEGNVNALKEALRKVARIYDYVFIDCPAMVNIMQLNAIMCADKLIIPATADAYAVRSIQHTIDVMESAQKVGSKITLAGILFTKVRKRGLLDNSVYDAARHGTYKGKVFKTQIHERAQVRQMAVLHNSIMDGNTETAREYYSLLDELKIKR